MSAKLSNTTSSQSLIDPFKDHLRPVGEVIQARLGKRISPATLWRWRLKGVNGVRLQCLRLGGSWVTSEAAFGEFLRAQTENALAACTGGRASDAPTEHSAERVRQIKSARGR